MKRHLFYVAERAVFCLLLLAFVTHPVSQAAKVPGKRPDIDLRKHPTGGKPHRRLRGALPDQRCSHR